MISHQAVLLGVAPLLVSIDGFPTPLSVIALESRDDWFELRLLEELVEDVGRDGVTDDDEGQVGLGVPGSAVPHRWEARTDAGNRHEGSLGGGGGGGRRMWWTVRFTPGLPPGVDELVLRPEGASGAEVSVALDRNLLPATTLPVGLGTEPLPRIGACERCGESLAEVNGKRRCRSCWDVIMSVGARSQEEADLWPKAVEPLAARLGGVFGASLDFLFIEAFEHWFNLCYRHASIGRNDPPTHGRWSATDDLGHEYVGIGNAAGADEAGFRGTLSFAPGLPARARRLDLVLHFRGEELLRTRVPLR